MNRSPLHDLNARLGARFVAFGDWEMPVQYLSVLAEHRAVRESVGVFDVTHLGRFELTGQGAVAAVRRLLCNDLTRIAPGRCQYTMLLDQGGGIVDDLIVWWWGEARMWVMPNAANHERVMSIFTDEPGCRVEDLQRETVFLALQGPEAPALLESTLGVAPARFRNVEGRWGGATVSMAGTGYTGEPGAEICADRETGASLIEALVAGGAVPCGLGARDTLRLEAGLPLWGEDIDTTTTPLEAGLGFAVSFAHDFVGRAALEEQRDHGVKRRLAGIVLDERGIPRKGCRIRAAAGAEGEVTSGNLSPMLDRGIGLGYVSPPVEEGAVVEIEIRNRWVTGHVVSLPFHEVR